MPTPATAAVTVAVRRPDDDRFLVLADGTLPTFELVRPDPWPVVTPIGIAMSDALGLDVSVLRAAWIGKTADKTAGKTADERLYEAVWLGGAVPPGADWIPLDGLVDRHRAGSDGISTAIVGGALTAASGDLQPWYVPGWLDGMTDWVDERLGQGGLRRRGSIRQVRSWGRSALLQADTDRGLVWAKEVPARFAHEVAVTGLLADLDPGLVPPVIAADTGAGRLLLAHVEGPLLAQVAEPLAWTATLARLAETQRVLSVERDRLSIAGVAPAPLASLAEEVPSILADRGLLRVGQPGGLSETVAAGLRSRGESIADACRDLAATGLPDSLDHGDLSAAQVIVGEMGPVIFDWSDASVTHPFLSLAAFLAGSDDPARPGRPDLLQAYLGPWTGIVDTTAFSAACDLADIVMPIHLARLYRDCVLPGLEQAWEMERVVPAALSRLAGTLSAGSMAR